MIAVLLVVAFGAAARNNDNDHRLRETKHRKDVEVGVGVGVGKGLLEGRVRCIEATIPARRGTRAGLDSDVSCGCCGCGYCGGGESGAAGRI